MTAIVLRDASPTGTRHAPDSAIPPMIRPNGHIAVITSPVPGHLNPLQVLGAELDALGWRVTIVHVRGTERFITNDSIAFVPLPEQPGRERLDLYREKLARPTGPIGLRRMIRATADITGALLADAPDVLRRIGADAVIADAVEPAGPLIAQHLGLPYVIAATGLPLIREEGVPPPFLGWRFRPGALGRFRNRGGYAVSDRLMRPITTVLDAARLDWGIGPDERPPLVQVAQCPRELDYPRDHLPANFLYGSPWREARAEATTLPDDGRPLVFCSLGTLQGSRRALFAVMAQACAALGARAVIGHGGGLTTAEEAMLPGDPLVRAFWPQENVLRHCAAAVLHGGFNTVLDALSAGVPIVALPIAFEQPATAARLARVGAGRVVSARSLTVRTLANALHEVMTRPTYRSAASRIATAIDADGGAAQAAAAIHSVLEPSTRRLTVSSTAYE
jgi:UDP:flavonoid glycosyltransferase YjiC (YdhE family)